MTQINPDKLAQLETFRLDEGQHGSFEDGHCAMEVVSWLADEGFTDAPVCASPVLRRYVIRLNDRWGDEKRQALKPYLVRMVGTGGDGKDEIRERIAARYVAGLLVPWYRLAGLEQEAARLEQVGDDVTEVRAVLRDVRDAAWNLRAQKWAEIRQKVEARLTEQGKPAAVAAAVAAAAAVAVAVAAAAAVAVAVAAADAAADAAAVAAAAAAAVADAVAVAVADAVAVAAADAAADAAAAAVAAAVADAEDPWGKGYSAAYKAARAYYDSHPLPITSEAAELAASQDGAALGLLDKLIAGKEAGS